MTSERLALCAAVLDRAGERRAEEGLVLRLLADPDTVVLPVYEGQAPVQSLEAGLATVALAQWSAQSWQQHWPQSWPLAEPQAAVAPEAVFLGRAPDGRAYLAVPVLGEQAPPLPVGLRWAGLREVALQLSDLHVDALCTAVAVLQWHRTHPCCARCGAATGPELAGWIRRCVSCGAQHHPRTDPAVIMTVEDAAGRILLGRQAQWPAARFSTLAGFVEPGESFEQAVRREVAEESGVLIGEVTYVASQPWPFPASVMVGFRAQALSEQIRVDEVELAEARWWDRQSLLADVRSGAVVLSSSLSISRTLIERWFGEPLP